MSGQTFLTSATGNGVGAGGPLTMGLFLDGDDTDLKIKNGGQTLLFETSPNQGD